MRGSWRGPRHAVAATRAARIADTAALVPVARLLQPVIGRFLRDDHVVHVALLEPRAGDAHETAARVQLLDGGRPAIAHAGPDAAHELLDHRGEGSLVRDHPLDAL